MKRFIYIFICIIQVLFFLNNSDAADRDALDPTVDSLPSHIIATQVLCALFPDVDIFTKLPSNKLTVLKNNIYKSSKNAKGEYVASIPRMFTFVDESYIIQMKAGNSAGHPRPKSRKREEIYGLPDILFVSTPIPALNNSVIGIVTNTSPRQTVIFTVNTKLEVDIIHSNKHKLNEKIDLWAVRMVEVVKENALALYSDVIFMGQNKDWPIDTDVYILSIVDGKIRIDRSEGDDLTKPSKAYK